MLSAVWFFFVILKSNYTYLYAESTSSKVLFAAVRLFNECNVLIKMEGLGFNAFIHTSQRCLNLYDPLFLM